MRSPKPYFVLLSVLTGFFLGVLYTIWALPEGHGLSGPRPLFWNVLAGVALCLSISLLLKDHFNQERVTKLNILLFFINLVPITWLVYSIFMLDPSPRSQIDDHSNSARMVQPFLFHPSVERDEDFHSRDLPYRYLPSVHDSSRSLQLLDSPKGKALP